MTVYLLRPELDGYQELALAEEQDWERLGEWFKGEPIGDAWRPVTVEPLEDDLAAGKPAGDFPALGGVIPVFSQRAIEALSSVLRKNGEVLPLTCREGDYFAFNCTQVVEALDPERSEVERFPSGNIFRISTYEFRPESLRGLEVFKLLHAASLGIYVTDRFVQRVREAGLEGFEFRPVWSRQVG